MFFAVLVTQYVCCLCECGIERDVKISSLINGSSKSCGCLHRENLIKRITKHGFVHEPLYKSWKRMIKRCYDENNASYCDYGKRGIQVCEEWRNDYLSYKNWSLENGYKEDLSLDRINNDGNYEPINCRWADLITQANNKRNNVFIEYDGKRLTVSQWARFFGVKRSFLDKGIKRHGVEYFFSVKINEPKNKAKTIEYNGSEYKIKDICKLVGIDRKTLSYRVNSGWSDYDAINKPVKKYNK